MKLRCCYTAGTPPFIKNVCLNAGLLQWVNIKANMLTVTFTVLVFMILKAGVKASYQANGNLLTSNPTLVTPYTLVTK